MKTKKMKLYTLDEIIDKHVGKRGTPAREHFEKKLENDLKKEKKRRLKS